MRLQIGKIWLIAIIGTATASEAKAQVVSSNPLEWMALAEGNELINDEIEKQINGQTKTALLQNTMAAEFNQIHKWEKKYNSYLKSVNGYASSLKACTHLYDDGVKIFITLAKLKAAIANNPQGIVASMSMNNLYIDEYDAYEQLMNYWAETMQDDVYMIMADGWKLNLRPKLKETRTQS